MREYYSARIRNIFTFTDKRPHYVVFKVLCIIIGAPIFFVMLPLDLINYFIYALFSWIPVVSTVFLVICKSLSYLFSLGYYIALLPDAKKYILIHKAKIQSEQTDESESDQEDTNHSI